MIETRTLFLRKMTKLGFLHFTNAPTEDAMGALPDVDAPTKKRSLKTVVLFHDESTFMANEDQPTQRGMKGEKMMKPKSKGAKIMVSDFIDEDNGFLALADEHKAAKASKPYILHVSSWSLETAGRDIGQVTGLLHRCIEQLRLPRSNTQNRMGGIMFGCSITAAAMLPWLMMLLTSAK